MRDTPRLQWLWTVVSLAAFLPSAFIALGVLATLPFSARSGAESLLITSLALCLPVACLLGPALGWNYADKGKKRSAKLARAAPLFVAAFLIVAVLAPL